MKGFDTSPRAKYYPTQSSQKKAIFHMIYSSGAGVEPFFLIFLIELI